MLAANDFSGSSPGTSAEISHTVSRSLRSLGTRPALATEDFPLPEAPTTATSGVRATALLSSLIAASLPKKNGESSSRK
jgi:hypothetical protein